MRDFEVLLKTISKYYNQIIAVAFLLLSFTLFSHSLHFNFFIFDDFQNITSNPRIINISTNNFIWFWKNSLTPVIFNCWQIISFFFSNSEAWPFRLANILIHGLNSFLVFLLATFIYNFFQLNYKKIVPLLAGLIFLIHPIVVESVVWPSSLRTVLTTFFAFLFIYFFLINHFKLNYLSIFFFIASILTNPISGGVIFILPISWFLFHQEIPIRKKDAFIDLLILGVFLLIFFDLHSENVLSSEYFSFLNSIDRTRIFIVSFAKYIEILTFPVSLHFLYQIRPDNPTSYTTLKTCISLLVILFTFFIPYIKTINLNKRFIIFIQLLLIALLFPNLGVFLHDFNNLSLVADRYAYLALFPFSVLISALFAEIFVLRKKLTLVFCSIALVLLATINFKTTFKWKNSPDMEINNLVYLIVKGVEAERYSQNELAESYFLRALKFYPNDSEPYAHLFRFYKGYHDKVKIMNFINLYEKSRALNMLPLYSYYDAAEVYFYLEDYIKSQQCLNMYLQSSRFNNNTLSLKNKLADILNDKKNYYLYQIILNHSLLRQKGDPFIDQIYKNISNESMYKNLSKNLYLNL